MGYRSCVAVLICASMTGVVGYGLASEWGQYAVGSKRSGYTYSTAETRAMQDDDDANPAFLWVSLGERLWAQVEGKAGKSCASCHGDAARSMKSVGATYPVYAPERDKLINIEQRINQCRSRRMQAAEWKWESNELLGMTAYVSLQSRGTPIDPKVGGAAAPFFKKGQEVYNQRLGQLDMACMHCHDLTPGRMLRGHPLSQGHPSAFPVYRLGWEKIGSLHRRFQLCNEMIRATPLPSGHDDYVDLELYLMWRARGLPMEAPGVRM